MWWWPFDLSSFLRCGLRTDEPNVGSSSRAAAAPRWNQWRRSRLRPERAPVQRAVASSPRRRCPAPPPPPPLLHPPPLRPLLSPLALLDPEWSTPLPPSPPRCRQSGARHPYLQPQPQSHYQTQPPPPAPPACSAQCRPPRLGGHPPTRCHTARQQQQLTARATQPQRQAPTSAAWNAAHIWRPCTPITTRTTHTSSAPWRAAPCRDTLTTTSASRQGTTTIITTHRTTTRHTARPASPSTPRTVWITKSRRRLRPGNSTSTPPTVWTTKTRPRGVSKCCDFLCVFFYAFKEVFFLLLVVYFWRSFKLIVETFLKSLFVKKLRRCTDIWSLSRRTQVQLCGYQQLIQDYFSTPELQRNWPIYTFWRCLVVTFQRNLQDCAAWDHLSDQWVSTCGDYSSKRKTTFTQITRNIIHYTLDWAFLKKLFFKNIMLLWFSGCWCSFLSDFQHKSRSETHHPACGCCILEIELQHLFIRWKILLFVLCREKKIKKKCELDTQCQYSIEIWKMYIRVFIIKSR